MLKKYLVLSLFAIPLLTTATGTTTQTISFPQLPDTSTTTMSLNLSTLASSTSGLGVAFLASGSCANDGSSLISIILNALGACTLVASQTGDDDFAAAMSVTQIFQIKKPQTISFISKDDIPESTDQNTETKKIVNIGGSASSGRPLTFTISDDSVGNSICENDLNQVDIMNGNIGSNIEIKKEQGECVITASQAGNEEYLAAEPVTRIILVNAAHGVSNKRQDAGPNNGDGNGDSIKDSLQTRASVNPLQKLVVTSDDNGSDVANYVTLEITPDPTKNVGSISFLQRFLRPQLPSGCRNFTEMENEGGDEGGKIKKIKRTDTTTVKTCQYLGTDTTYFFPVGGFAFGFKGAEEGKLGTTTVSIYLDKKYDTTGWTLKKASGEGRGVSGPGQSVSIFTDGPEATFTTVTVGGIEKTKITYLLKDGGPFDMADENGEIIDPVFVLAPLAPVVVVPPVIVPPAPISSGGGGFVFPPSTSGNIFNTAPIIISANGTTPKVLGASTSCGLYLPLAKRDYIAQGHKKNDAGLVIKLKKFLNTNLGLKLKENSTFDTATTKAVRDFQSKYMGLVMTPWDKNEATGIVYVTTANTINNIVCPELDLKFTKDDLIVIKR